MVLNCVYSSETEKEVVSNPLFADADLNTYIKEISKYKNLTLEEEQETARLAKEGNVAAKQKLIKANLKLVITIAKKVIHSSKLPMIDLIQEGNLGLIAAVDKFNWKFGYRFSTYASWWIKQAMFKAISEQSHSFKIPVYIQETLSRYSKFKAELEKQGCTDINPEKIAEKMNTDLDRINNCLNAYKQTLSLDANIEANNGSEVRLSDIIEDKKSSFQNDLEYESMKKDILGLINKLKDREQNVIIMRFGLFDRQRQTLEDIGKIYGVTKECIRQTEARALNKLKTDNSAFNLRYTYLY